MSASMRPTRAPLPANAAARLADTVDLPTPPFPDEIARTAPRFGCSIGVGGGGTAPGAPRAAPLPPPPPPPTPPPAGPHGPPRPRRPPLPPPRPPAPAAPPTPRGRHRTGARSDPRG